mgnify:CR=1 FL=1
MIISISGFDGVGKTTSVELISKLLSEKYGLKKVSAIDLNGNSEFYNNIEDLDELYDELKEYDIITTRFYMRSPEFQDLQTKIMFAGEDVFKNKEFVKNVIYCARVEADYWYKKVIKKLIKQGKIIIFDRYYYDEIAYRSIYGIEKNYIDNIYHDYPKSDIAFFLSAPIEFIFKRNFKREDIKTTLFKSNQKMQELYINLEEISKDYNMLKIEVENKTREEIVSKIFEILSDNKCFKENIQKLKMV